MIQRYECNGRLARVVEYNGILYLTGRTCGEYEGIQNQTRGLLKILEDTLEKYGSDKCHILKAQIFLKDIKRDIQAMNEVWESWVIPGYEPARATVQAAMAREHLLIEIVMTAAKCDSKKS